MASNVKTAGLALLGCAAAVSAQMTGGDYQMQPSAISAGGTERQNGGYATRALVGSWGSFSSGGIYSETSSPLFALLAVAAQNVSPVNGSIVQGRVPLSVQRTGGVAATDSPSTARIEYYVDGALLGAAASSPFTYVWETTSSSNGSHAILAKIYDTSGQSSQTPVISLTVANGGGSAPFGEVFAYPNPASKGRVTIHVESAGLDSLQIRAYDLAGALIHRADLTGPPGTGVDGKQAYEQIWYLGGIAAGAYIYVVEGKLGGQSNRAMGKIAVIR